MSKIRCIRPFKDIQCSKELRYLTDGIIQKLKSIGFSKVSTLNTKDFRICSSCRLHIDSRAHLTQNEEQSVAGGSRMPTVQTIPVVPDSQSYESLVTIPSASTLSTIQSNEDFTMPVDVEIFNRGIAAIRVSPIDLGKVKNVHYPEKKCAEIVEGVRRNLFKLDAKTEKANEFNEVIENMKIKFLNSATRQEKLSILSLLPKSWSVQKIVDEFKTSRNMASDARKEKNNVLDSSQGSSSGKALSNETKELVLNFFEDDDISRAMPGQRDFVSVKTGNKRLAVQKRLLMMTLREAFNRFNEVYVNVKIGFSSFASLRPRQCKLLTITGTHNVCVCTTHENVNLILHSLKKYNVLNDLKTLTNRLLCENKTTHCHLRRCKNCPDTSVLEDSLLKQLEENFVEKLSFEQWVTTDRCDLETIVKQTDDFVTFFSSKLESLIPHDFVKTEQSNFLKTTKQNLQDGEFLAICDFSENYSFVLQDEVQSHHWNVQQATIHPFVIYYTENMQIKHFSFIIISEELRHDSVAVNLFIDKMINFLQIDQNKNMKKIYFMSDGAASQYKNRKNFSSLCKFKSKYGIDAEWHFFATSHGKGPCDAIGGTIKRMATRASLAKEREHPIKTARELFNWANKRKEEELTKLSFCYSTTEEYENMSLQLNNQYNNAKTIQGTQKFHSFLPLSENTIKAKLYSNCPDNDAKIFDIVKKVV